MEDLTSEPMPCAERNANSPDSAIHRSLDGSAPARRALDLWGGLECSVNRVCDRYHDQLARSRHDLRRGDLDLIAGLGIRVLRYPVLWEHHEHDPSRWATSKSALETLRARQVEPVVGLVHHGSGPPETSLLDPGFAGGLARHAAEVARAFPWIRYYNPVNEPLTTARFSGLYGHWYPHHRETRSFVRAFLIQCHAIRQSMQAVREVNPQALLVQTEDMGYTRSTPLLAYQAEFDNHRRWLSLDLLSGLVDPEHPLWRFLVDHGASESELDSFLQSPCPPDIIGINYYVTSERFLDERLERYPARNHGGNHQHQYADVAAVRVCASGLLGLPWILREVHDRYQSPIAVTEAHLGCTREEQLRWLTEVWESAQKALAAGCDIRAVTVWSLFGAYEWNSLLTREEGYYEPGAFDLRGAHPRPTALGRCIQSLVQKGNYQHPVLTVPGWWHRPERLLYPPVPSLDGSSPALPGKPARARPFQPLLILGGRHPLNVQLAQVCAGRGLASCLPQPGELTFDTPTEIEAALERLNPWAVLLAMGPGLPAQTDGHSGGSSHDLAPATIASACARRGVPFLLFSELSSAAGQDARSAAENEILEAHSHALILRSGLLFGAGESLSALARLRRALVKEEKVKVPADVFVSLSYIPDLLQQALDLLIDQERGVWHMVNSGAVSWADLASRIARLAGLSESNISPFSAAGLGPPVEMGGADQEGASVMPSLDDALARYMSELEY